jgi:hypothetical protein
MAYDDYDDYFDYDAPLISCALCGANYSTCETSRFVQIDNFIVCRNTYYCRTNEYGAITDAPGVTLEISVCSERFSYLATFQTESQVMEFIERLNDRDTDYRIAYGYGNHCIDEIGESPIPATWTRLVEYLYPQCHHGLSLALCADPINHYPADM